MMKGQNINTYDVETIKSDDGSLFIKSNASEPVVTLTRKADTTAYDIGDVIGTATSATLEFTNVCNTLSSHYIILGASLEIDVNAVPSGMGAFRLHLFRNVPTTVVDNTAFNLVVADRMGSYIGYIDFDTPIDLGNTLFSRMNNINIKAKLSSTTTSVFGILQTLSAFTPSSECVKQIRLSVVGV